MGYKRTWKTGHLSLKTKVRHGESQNIRLVLTGCQSPPAAISPTTLTAIPAGNVSNDIKSARQGNLIRGLKSSRHATSKAIPIIHAGTPHCWVFQDKQRPEIMPFNDACQDSELQVSAGL